MENEEYKFFLNKTFTSDTNVLVCERKNGQIVYRAITRPKRPSYSSFSSSNSYIIKEEGELNDPNFS